MRTAKYVRRCRARLPGSAGTVARSRCLPGTSSSVVASPCDAPTAVLPRTSVPSEPADLALAAGASQVEHQRCLHPCFPAKLCFTCGFTEAVVYPGLDQGSSGEGRPGCRVRKVRRVTVSGAQSARGSAGAHRTPDQQWWTRSGSHGSLDVRGGRRRPEDLGGHILLRLYSDFSARHSWPCSVGAAEEAQKQRQERVTSSTSDQALIRSTPRGRVGGEPSSLIHPGAARSPRASWSLPAARVRHPFDDPIDTSTTMVAHPSPLERLSPRPSGPLRESRSALPGS